MNESWKLPYFSGAVDRIVGPYMERLGFTRAEGSEVDVGYRRGRTFVSVSYYLEDLPSPWVSVEVGVVSDDGSHLGVALWRAMRDDDPARQYTQWRFTDEASLERVLQRVVAEVLDVHGRRVWEDEVELAGLLASQEAEVQARYSEDRLQEDLRRARRAFDVGRFQEAVDVFTLLGPENLSAADRRRLYVAQRSISSERAKGECPR